MGSGKSRQTLTLSENDIASEKKHRGSLFRRRKPRLITQHNSDQDIYSVRRSPIPFPIYGSMSPPSLPIPYNNFLGSQFMPQIAPIMSSPYMGTSPLYGMGGPFRQQLPGNPLNSNIIASSPIQGGGFRGMVFNPTPNPLTPGRLITDWTGGGQISPGFLGPPI